MTFKWKDLDYWQCGEWQVIKEHLADLTKEGKTYNPVYSKLFAAIREVKYEDAKVMIVGQDPYPNAQHATGIAFSIPKEIKTFPVTLSCILKEYSNDLHYPTPEHGDLSRWVHQGVILWNAVPSCETGKPGSHMHWDEWSYLTKEIVEKLSEKGIVFAFLGGVARNYVKYVNLENNRIIETSHPSPRGNLNSKSPFLGSRLFSTINAKLNELGLGVIDWKL